MKIERMNKGTWGKVRAFFDITTSDGFTIKGFKIIEGINGLFVSLPSQKEMMMNIMIQFGWLLKN